jgi:hypothetical protein
LRQDATGGQEARSPWGSERIIDKAADMGFQNQNCKQDLAGFMR